MRSTLHPRKNHVELAQRILDLARRQGLVQGARLGEQQFADLCGVSRTPVRAALALLSARGLAEKEDDGFRLKADPSQADLSLSLPEDEEDALAGVILRDHAARRLEPSVTVAALARRYRQDRKVVLRTLERLSGDGVIDRGPGQAWVFRPATDGPDAIAESYEFRLLVEPAVLSGPKFSLDTLEAAASRDGLENLVAQPDERFDRAEFHRLDNDFHLMIAAGAANRFLGEALAQHLRLRKLPRAHSGVSLYRLRQSAREHLAILDAVENGQAEIAADLMRVHLRASKNQGPAAAGRGVPTLRLVPGRRA